MVISAQGALVRTGLELDSPEVYSLRFGDVVTCAEIIGRRARIIDPVEGWVSLMTSSNESLFELTFPPDKRTQTRTMERRFEKLKQQQAGRQGDSSPVAAPVVHRATDSQPADDGVTSLKSKIVFKSSSESSEAPVPRLGAVLPKRTLAPPPTVKASGTTAVQEDLLLDFDSPDRSSQATPQPVNTVPTEFSLL